MNKVKTGSRTEKFWSEHVKKWQRSGRTQVAYCQTHRLKPSQFGYWARKTIAGTVSRPDKFVEVQKDKIQGESPVNYQISLPGGSEIRIIAGIENIRDILKAVRETVC